MGTPIKLSAGGGVFAITTTPAAFDLSALAGRHVAIYCDTQAILFSGAPDGSNTTLVSTATAASLTALIADKVAAGLKAVRLVRADMPFLIAATDASTGTLIVKVVSDKDFGQ
jgi:hypothetical protein